MQLRNAILFHMVLLSIQPGYYTLRYVFNYQFFSSASLVWVGLALTTWLYILTRLTIPTLTSPLLRLPSPAGDYFPFGHVWTMRAQPPPSIMIQACKDTPNDGIVALWDPFYIRVRLVLTTPDTIMEVLNSHTYDWAKPTQARRILGRVLGEGLINVEGDTHKAMRKTVAPAFSGRHIRDLVPLFWSKGVALTDVLARSVQESTDGVVEVAENMSKITLDIIGAAGVGTDLDTIHGGNNRLAKLYATVTGTDGAPTLLFVLVNVLMPPWLVRKMRGTVYGRVASAIEELRVSVRGIIAKKQKSLKQEGAEHNDIIATIMRSGDFSEDFLYDQLLTFFAAGHETTASALAWTAWFLATNQHVQNRLRKECQQQLLGVPNQDVTAEPFDQMPYLNAVCAEMLRFYPTVPATARTAVKDARIGELLVPQGTIAVIAPWMTNRDVTYWGEDAETFNPDRWIEGPLAASGGANNPYAFQTFLFGPRSCIGQGFARTEMKCLLAAMVLRFRLLPSHDNQEVKPGGFLTIKPKGGLCLKLEDLRSTESELKS